MKLDSISALVEGELLQVEHALREAMNSVAPLIPVVGEHTFGGGGKRIRPILVLLASRLCGYRGPRAIQIASAVELLHTATLLHDDVIDRAETRRGRPSVSAVWGDRIAILVGDFLYARASLTLVEDGDPEILWSYSNTIREMSEGEVLQLQHSFDPEISESVYLDIIRRKTARLIANATESGAILAGVTRAERRALHDYGTDLGMAFQLVDDALDYAGDGGELGKGPLADLAEGKVTMPLILTLKRCSGDERASISAALKTIAARGLDGGRAPDPAEIEPITAAVRRHAGAELTRERARSCAQEASAKLGPFADCDGKRALLALTQFVVERKR